MSDPRPDIVLSHDLKDEPYMSPGYARALAQLLVSAADAVEKDRPVVGPSTSARR